MKRHLILSLLCLIFVQSSTTIYAGDDSTLVEDGAEVKKLAGDMSFTEGPVWLPKEKMLIFSDIPASKLMQWTEQDGLSVYRESEQANGNILDMQGRLISCQHAGRNVIRTEPNGDITVLADKFAGKRFNSPNDVAFRSDGTLWFTDPAWGLREPHELEGHWVFKLDPATGELDVLLKDLAMPNGISFSPDESRIYIADTGGHPKHPDASFHDMEDGIYCYEITADGKLGEKLFTINQGSDGMAVDVKGNLYTTHGGKVHVFNADGEKLEVIDVPEGPANVCFGGDDLKTLFITARTSLYSVRMKNAGAMPPSK